jgi:hypothetical protein
MKSIFKIILILVVLIIGVAIAFTASSFRPNVGPLGIKNFSKGSFYPEGLIAALTPGPIRDDLLKRGVLLTGSNGDQGINFGDIANLIQQGLYSVDPNGHLQLGPVPIPAEAAMSSGNNSYIYSQRTTQLWAFLDDFNYTGHSVYVTLPASLNLPSNSSTIHNLYNTHLTLPDGNWVESGVGWVNWTASPILYTYNSYHGQWNFISIPAGAQRDIFLKVEITPDLQAVMSASDPQSLKSANANVKVKAIRHRIDFSQEQTSPSGKWMNTPPARFHDSQIRKSGSDWVKWDTSTISTWSNNPPMAEKTGLDNGQIWTVTWCSESN